ncbi:MAG: 4Fe-4S dicluster domain-containing protein [Candidatus Lambdaproteobacteria bacterium]|nr:4Fe-4S dicluster domain-containing protein [Candidatus Lambdaproteobacteria bacterium]
MLNEIVRMHDDLDRALAKPERQRSWVMVIDTRRCVQCFACVAACTAENVSPPGKPYRKVVEAEDGDYPDTDRFFMPSNCMQCDNPPCMKAANAHAKGAIQKRTDGIVVFNYEKLAGSGDAREAAKDACPYAAAIVEDQGGYHTEGTPRLEAYETRTFQEYDRTLRRTDTKGALRKCTFCQHRLANGMLPACVTTCEGRAMYFGDRNDPNSLVSELLRAHKGWRMYEEKGTRPRVYYVGYETRGTISVSTPAACAGCH